MQIDTASSDAELQITKMVFTATLIHTLLLSTNMFGDVYALFLESMTIDFNRTLKDNCPSFTLEPEVIPPDFKPHHLYGKPGQTVFTVEIGQSASEQGYTALTGRQHSWMF